MNAGQIDGFWLLPIIAKATFKEGPAWTASLGTPGLQLQFAALFANRFGSLSKNALTSIDY